MRDDWLKQRLKLEYERMMRELKDFKAIERREKDNPHGGWYCTAYLITLLNIHLIALERLIAVEDKVNKGGEVYGRKIWETY
jgi:hypothetical protein